MLAHKLGLVVYLPLGTYLVTDTLTACDLVMASIHSLTYTIKTCYAL